MLGLTQSKFSRARELWRKHLSDYYDFNESALRLLQHPDSTQDQIYTVIHKLRDVHARHIEAANLLRAQGFAAIVERTRV